MILTSTPNKDELEQSISVASKQKQKVVRRIGDDTPGPSDRSMPKKICKRRKPTTSSSESDSSEENFPLTTLVGKKSRKNDQDSSDDDIPLVYLTSKVPDSDVICIFCEGLFSKSRSREIWIQCVMCECWAHEACTGNEHETYICDFCK